MHGMRWSSKEKLSKPKVSRFEIIARISVARVIAKAAFILAIVINTKIAKIKASFLAFGITDI